MTEIAPTARAGPLRAPRSSGLAAGLIAAGLIYFAHAVGALGGHTERDGFLALGGLALLALARRIDPAWLLTAGLVSTMFASHWALLGLSSTVGLDRILLGGGALSLLLRLRPARDRPRLQITGLHLLLGAALGYAALSAFVSGTLTDHSSLFYLIDQYGALPFFMFLIAPVAFRTERQRQILVGGLVTAGAYLSLTAIFERLGVTALVVPHYISDPSVGIHFGRARGPFVDAGADGLALFTCVIAAAVAYRSWRRPRPRAVAAGVVLLGLVGVLLTKTRGDWLAVAVGTAVALATTPGLRRFLLPSAAAMTVLVIGAVGVIPGLAQELQSRLNDQSSVYERDNTNAAGLRMLAARPLLGFGWNLDPQVLLPYFRTDPNIPLTGAEAGFSNLFLQYAVLLGLVGFGLWLLATGSAFVAAIRGPPPAGMELWSAALKAMVVAWVVMGLTAPTDYIFSTLVMWAWAGVIYGVGRSSEGLRPSV